ncbi:hypothetical protein [Gleimia hominis]|uniref:hypothetical protein n=1 Tax=Gleimia hominis TaxID=595468 RepID=UPI000C80EC4E|nr:hypothetical protein [Gleimia hominis]WIK64328.1 hypothetical protein CJ187_008510 [Gleimia hominis]
MFFTAFGKQALSLVAQDLRRQGVRRLVAPDYFCLSMILPFELEGISVRYCPTDRRALPVPQRLAELVTPGSAVLLCFTFGNLPTAQLVSVLEGVRAGGVPIVVDGTHSWLGPQANLNGEKTQATQRADGGGFASVALRAKPGYADYYVVSMRKLLPVPDGAFVHGLEADSAFVDTPFFAQIPGSMGDSGSMGRFGSTSNNAPPSERATVLALEAMRSRKSWLAELTPRESPSSEHRGGHIINHGDAHIVERWEARRAAHKWLQALDAAEDAIEQAWSPAPISACTRRFLRTADLEEYARKRRSVGSLLIDSISHRFEVVNLHTVECGVVVRTEGKEHTRHLLDQLLEIGVSSPIYWQRPAGLARNAPWPEDLLTLSTAPDQPLTLLDRIIETIC